MKKWRDYANLMNTEIWALRQPNKPPHENYSHILLTHYNQQHNIHITIRIKIIPRSQEIILPCSTTPSWRYIVKTLAAANSCGSWTSGTISTATSLIWGFFSVALEFWEVFSACVKFLAFYSECNLLSVIWVLWDIVLIIKPLLSSYSYKHDIIVIFTQSVNRVIIKQYLEKLHQEKLIYSHRVTWK